MYRKTEKYKQQCDKLENWRKAKQQKRLNEPPPDYPHELPNRRMRITIERFDFGEEKHVVELFKTNRIDLYNVTIDGQPWKNGLGLSRVLEWIRKALPRVRSARTI